MSDHLDPQYVSQAEFSRIIELMQRESDANKQDILRAVGSGFDGVNGRLDTLNSKTASQGMALTEHKAAIATLEERTGADWLARAGAGLGLIGTALASLLHKS